MRKWNVSVENVCGWNQNSFWSNPVEVSAPSEQDAARKVLGAEARQVGAHAWRKDWAIAHVSPLRAA